MLLAVLGTPEIIIIVVVILLLFGPAKLPQLGAGIGKMLRGFKKEMRALDDEKDEKDEKGEAVGKDHARDEIDVTPKNNPGKRSGAASGTGGSSGSSLD